MAIHIVIKGENQSKLKQQRLRYPCTLSLKSTPAVPSNQ